MNSSSIKPKGKLKRFFFHSDPATTVTLLAVALPESTTAAAAEEAGTQGRHFEFQGEINAPTKRISNIAEWDTMHDEERRNSPSSSHEGGAGEISA